MAYFPFFIELSGRRGVVVGGGSVARRKVEKLLPFGPALTVVAPEVEESIAALPVTVVRRRFADGDLDGAFFAVAATNDTEVNARVSRLCAEKGILCNVVDNPTLCSFIFPALVKNPLATLAISTDGRDPRFAKRLREHFEPHFAPLKLGTRGSALALAQTKIAEAAIRARFPARPIETVTLTTHGDRDRTTPLEKMGGFGAFAKELERALLAREIDVAVHSAKDLPLALAPGLVIAAVLPRGDPRDVLVTRLGEESPKCVGTSSVRRRAALKRLLPSATAVDIRGNVDTRLKKLRAGEVDGVLLALAGLERLHLDHEPDLAYRVFSIEELVPAACQGILALETRALDAPLFASLDDPATRRAFEAERQALDEKGGDCSRPVGAYARVDEAGRLKLTVCEEGL